MIEYIMNSSDLFTDTSSLPITRTMGEGTAMLTLPIKRQWFDEILSGTKTIEYREIKPYWTSRFMKVTGIEVDPEEAVWKLKRRFNG